MTPTNLGNSIFEFLDTYLDASVATCTRLGRVSIGEGYDHHHPHSRRGSHELREW